MAAINPITVSLPADLPENWQLNDIVSPSGSETGLTPQHGYNYLMQQVNAAQQALQQVAEYFPNLASVEDGGGFILYTGNMPVEQRKPRNLYAHVVVNYS